MISKVMSSTVPKVLKTATTTAGEKGSRLTKFMQNPVLGKMLDVAADNPVICQSAFSLALCCVARPITNFLVTKDKQDATYASCHSIASGGIGFIWPLIFATPLSKGVKKVLAKPQKYLNPELIQKFYPNVAVVDNISKEGKKLGIKIKTNAKGQMLRKNGTVLCQDLEPLMVYGKTERAAFEKANAGFYVDKGGVVRSKTVFKTEGGKFKLDEKGNKIGCAVQRDMTPITEEMEIGVKKEQNVKNFVNMIPDILLAPPRAALTIALIPPLLGMFGIKKKPKGNVANNQQQQAQQKLDVTSKTNNVVASNVNIAGTSKSPFSAMKKGGV